MLKCEKFKNDTSQTRQDNGLRTNVVSQVSAYWQVAQATSIRHLSTMLWPIAMVAVWACSV